EFASRVGIDGKVLRDYPWGDDAPTCDKVRYGNCGSGGKRDVGTTTADATPAGVKDLAGSVAEWVEDTYVASARCADRGGYTDRCGDAACAKKRCELDKSGGADLCLIGCLADTAELDSVRSGAQITQDPLCPMAPSGTRPVLDPVSRTTSPFAVVRGAG